MKQFEEVTRIADSGFNKSVKAILIMFFGILVSARGQAPIGSWVQRHAGAYGVPNGKIAGLVVDDAGNAIVAGGNAWFIVKYSQSGVPSWTNRFIGPDAINDIPAAIGVDKFGNAFVTGRSGVSSFNDDYATIKYSSSGVPLWTNYYDGPGHGDDVPAAAAVDADGNFVVTGGSMGGCTTIKYSTSGVALWTNHFPSVWPVALATDKNGSVFIGADYGFGGGLYSLVTIGYSSEGILLWTNSYHGPGNGRDQFRAVATDTGGNVFIAGGSQGIGSALDFVTIKYSAAGAPLWTNRFSGSGNNDDIAHGIAVADDGDVFVTGGVFRDFSFNDYATIKYSSSGAPLWTNYYNGHPNGGNDVAYAVAVDGQGNATVTGESNTEFATVTYSGSGDLLWTKRYSGPGVGDDSAQAVVIDRNSRSVYVAGISPSDFTSQDYTTIKYSITDVPLLSIQRLEDQVVLSWTNQVFKLQAAQSLSDTFAEISDARSPYTNSMSEEQQFFRLAAP